MKGSGGTKATLCYGLATACFVLFVMVWLAAPSYAQTQATAANLTGTITDEQGAVIDGAKITISDDAKNFRREVQSLQDGTYRLLVVPPGTYQVTVEAQGFTKA